MNKQQLAAKIWESANKMRSKIESNEYKDYILGFIFYKFLSDKLVETLKKSSWTDEDLKQLKEEDEQVVQYCQMSFGYFIAYENLFSTWLKKGKDFDVSNVRDALSAFERLINKAYTKVFYKIFDTLQNGLSKLGDTSGAQTKAISDLIHLIDDIPMDGKQDYDVLGFIYEYLIGMFAANAGKKAGEFYTPHEVSLLMSEIVSNHLKEKEKIEIYDPTSGSGSLLINIGKSVAKYMKDPNNIKYYAQELKENTYNLTRMNLIMRGILPDNIITRNGDTLKEDWPFFDEEYLYTPLYVDAVVSNPPYSQLWEPEDKESDPRYARYGIAPKSKADYAFLLHDLYHIKPEGIMTIVLPHGVLFRGGAEGEIRKNLIENNNIDAIIGLPANIFFGTGIPTIIMVLRQRRSNNDVLIIDASKEFIKVGKNNKLQSAHIKKIVDTVIQRKTIEKYSKIVTREEIRENEYNLNIPRYVDSSEPMEKWDIYASIYGGIPNSEILDFKKYWDVFPNLRNLLFKELNESYSSLTIENIDQIINKSTEIISYNTHFNQVFYNFNKYLEDKLIKNFISINIQTEKELISREIFSRLESFPLIDKYDGYQLFDDLWEQISSDLEIMKSEGFQAVKKVDPKIVIKKKQDKEIEVQDGYIGHIIPFELVQKVHLFNELASIRKKESKISEIQNRYDEIFELVTEEEKELMPTIFNDSKTSFVNSEVLRYVKTLDKKELFGEESIEFKLIEISKLISEEKELTIQVDHETNMLQGKTKTLIENLSDEAAENLLKEKWITPLISGLTNLPKRILNEFISKIKKMVNKYEKTFLDIEKEIKEVSNLLINMMDELEGNEFDIKGLCELKALLGGN